MDKQMAKKEKVEQMEKREMTLEESKAFRASLYKPEVRELTEKEKREQFRVFWAKSKKQYGKSKELEEILWVHLKSTKMAEPEKFEAGIAHFGLKKVK
jgi:hypothetical protein